MRCAGPIEDSGTALPRHTRFGGRLLPGEPTRLRHTTYRGKKAPNNLETHICCPLLLQRLCNITSFLNLLIRLPGSQYVSKDQGFAPRGKPITPGDAWALLTRRTLGARFLVTPETSRAKRCTGSCEGNARSPCGVISMSLLIPLLEFNHDSDCHGLE